MYNRNFQTARCTDRNKESVRKRAAVIKRYCVKFSKHVARVQKLNPSSFNYNDILKIASDLWNKKAITCSNNDFGKMSCCMEAWKLAKESP